MPFADKKTWEKTRPLACHGSGVGKACDAWSASCKNPQQIAPDQKKVTAALKAIDQMSKALTKAEGKANKVTDKKAKTKVLSLISDWRAEVERYHGQLSGHVVLVSEQNQEQQKNEFVEEFTKLANDVLDDLKTMVKKQLAEIKKAVEDEDFGIADRKIRSAEMSIREGERMTNDPQIPFKNVLKRYKEIPKGSVTLRDVDSALAHDSEDLHQAAGQLDELKRQVEQAAGSDAPDSYEFRPKFLDAQDKAKKSIAKIKKATTGMKGLTSRLKTLAGNQKALTEGDPDKVVTVTEMIIQSMRTHEEAAAEAFMGDSIDISNLRDNRKFTDEKAKKALTKMTDDIQTAYRGFSQLTTECRGYAVTILETVQGDPSKIKDLLKRVKFT